MSGIVINGKVAENIKRFVQRDLGCSCTDDVFDHIEMISDPDFNLPDKSKTLIIGSRLLLTVWMTEDLDGVGPRLSDLMLAGQCMRDKLNLNRFRLIIATDNPRETCDILRPYLGTLPNTDDRTHLHMVWITPTIRIIINWEQIDEKRNTPENS